MFTSSLTFTVTVSAMCMLSVSTDLSVYIHRTHPSITEMRRWERGSGCGSASCRCERMVVKCGAERTRWREERPKWICQSL